jgi:hypothetical protein
VLALFEAESDSLAASLSDALWLCPSYILLSSDSRAETLSCVLVEILSRMLSFSLSLKDALVDALSLADANWLLCIETLAEAL